MDKIPEPHVLTIDPNDENIILDIPEDKDPNTPETPAKKEKVCHWMCSHVNTIMGWLVFAIF